ncbi:hypothetical protein V495_00102 [Pseudogymnoascus sp. VKM F-4514 (FW-929)]|nr:hypothetical protein V495_00102 [Pseudogymnoascus sp. VKM F-4514 (FW-929)]
MDALERRIAADEATSQETTKTDDDGFAEQMEDITQTQDIPKVSAPEILLLPQHLREMKALTSNFFQSHPKKVKRNATMNRACVDETTLTQPATMFTIKGHRISDSPTCKNLHQQTSYEYIRQSDQVTIVRQRSSYFRLANMQESPAANIVQQSQVLARVSHPNIASIYGVYSYIDKLLVVTEHLDISLAQLDFQSYKTEEWEIATIVAEVLKGLTYMSSKDISCQDLTTASIRLSVRGEIKLLLSMENIRYHQVENPRFAPALLEMPVLEEIIEAMTLPRYHHTSDDQRWSKEAPALLEMPVLEEIIEAMTLPRYHHTSDDQRRLLVSYPAQYRTWLDLFPLPPIAYPHDLFMVKRLKVPDDVREVCLLQESCHNSFHECFSFEGAHCAVFEHVPISLAHVAKSRSFLTEVELAAILGQILEGLAHLASIGLEHGSLSCSNILFGTGEDITVTGGEVPGDGVVRPAKLAGHKNLGEHNNGADTEIHQK